MTADNRRKLLDTNAGWPRRPGLGACRVCGGPMDVFMGPRKRYCSQKCAKRAWRAARAQD